MFLTIFAQPQNGFDSTSTQPHLNLNLNLDLNLNLKSTSASISIQPHLQPPPNMAVTSKQPNLVIFLSVYSGAEMLINKIM